MLKKIIRRMCNYEKDLHYTYEKPSDPDPLLSALEHLSVLFTLNSFILSSFFSASDSPYKE